ncbi:TonB-dependent receptor domain-containing protein [Pasteurella multocida]|uniref:TonB-dependent receptor domain-containing protein n=1 Tax=Pasteurella multocida TaxID=747 RepID=UPI00189872F7|nr:TonB-dependent receptor [Pasteurella multocida]MBF6984168.1 TonB-dependent receptor [Pasteurella multocida]MDA5611342.1 TonB-dependent receptor [Pasteurella multocida]MDA5613557.1 TonB-dependent receptor [Pasteurella multocida]
MFAMKKSNQLKHHSLAMGLLLMLLNLSVAQATTLETIVVGGKSGDKGQAGKDEIFTKDQVTEYKSKKEIETFHGESVSDLFSGITGVYSGDARNGGAVDPIIRSAWGQGRIPVLVDDTEQSITIWRGYAGVSNRNYLDPFLISSISVEKGPNLNRSLRTGSAGTVRMNTLSVDDIVKPGEKWGIELKVETANNSIKKRPGSYIFGEDYRKVSQLGGAELGEWAAFFKGDDRQEPRSGGRNKFFNDNAIRLAVATKQDKFEGLAAYAYRNKGNYYAGSKGGHRYGEGKPMERNVNLYSDDPYVPYIAKIYYPKYETPNTSYESKSLLLKGKYYINDYSNVNMNFRQSDIQYGDIMPSRLGQVWGGLGTVLEWPLANVKQKSISFNYELSPPDNKWIDLKIGAWALWNKTLTNTAGGSPMDVLFSDQQYTNMRMEAINEAYSIVGPQYMQMHPDWNFDFDDPNFRKEVEKELVKLMKEKTEAYLNSGTATPNTDGIFNTQKAHAQFARDNHWGLTISNRFELHPRLNLDVMANYRRETLETETVFGLWEKYQLPGAMSGTCSPTNPNACKVGISSDAKAAPRKGTRNEFNAGFRFEYMPTDWLMLTAGMKYTHYKSKDKGLQEKIKDMNKEAIQNPSVIKLSLLKVRELEEVDQAIAERYKKTYNRQIELTKQFAEKDPKYDTLLSQGMTAEEICQQAGFADSTCYPYFRDERDARFEEFKLANNFPELSAEEKEFEEKYFNGQGSGMKYDLVKEFFWYKNEYGNYSGEAFPTFNGEVDPASLKELVENPITGKNEEVIPRNFEGAGNLLAGDKIYRYRLEGSAKGEHIPLTDAQWEAMKKAERKDHAWAPSFSATVFLSPNVRIYARYDETKRMPSLFEDTIGYSVAVLTPLYKRKPEHSKNIEIGYVHDLRGFFPRLRRADIRLNWYKNTTKNIFDRDANYEMRQFEKRILEGLELQGRYDQGNFFADLGISYNIRNKFCDKESAIINNDFSIRGNNIHPVCVNGGNANGYLKNTILPKYSITSNLGMRLLDEKLELGTRLVYHTNVKDTRNKSLFEAGFPGYSNVPRWTPVFLVDAYINYQVNEHLLLTLSGTNLTDRYYLDPMTRSSMPAPGRTVKFGLTAKF